MAIYACSVVQTTLSYSVSSFHILQCFAHITYNWCGSISLSKGYLKMKDIKSSFAIGSEQCPFRFSCKQMNTFTAKAHYLNSESLVHIVVFVLQI